MSAAWSSRRMRGSPRGRSSWRKSLSICGSGKLRSVGTSRVWRVVRFLSACSLIARSLLVGFMSLFWGSGCRFFRFSLVG